MHSDLKYISQLIKLSLSGRISDLETNILTKAAQHLAVTRLMQLRSCGKLYVNALPVTIELTALDCIADIFERDSNGLLIKLFDYFSDNRNIQNLSDEEILNHFSILIVNKLNDGLYRLYADNDPYLNHIIRNIKWSITTCDLIKQVNRFGKVNLYTCDEDERLDHLPEIPSDNMEILITACHYKNRKTKNFLLSIFNELNVQETYRRVYPLIDLAFVLRRLFALKKIPIEEIYCPVETTSEQDITLIVKESLIHNRTILCKKFLDNNKLETETFEKYFSAIENIITDTYIQSDGHNLRYFDYLHKQIPKLKYEDYRTLHHNQFEYMVRIVNEYTKNKLKELF